MEEPALAAQFSDKVALVTGSGSGIGRASAQAFATGGASVIVSDINVEGGEETVQMIKDAGGEATFVKADVSSSADVEALVQRAVEVYGRLDCAHNNAGMLGAIAPLADQSEEDWDRLIATNLTGVFLCLRYEIPQMVAQGSGSIVNTSSAVGLIGMRSFAPYVASKHGVVGLTKTAALDYAAQGVRVNAVCPGFVDTPMTSTLAPQGFPAEVLPPMGRIATPQEIAEAVVWLCSDASSYVTGHTMVVDGAMIAE